MAKKKARIIVMRAVNALIHEPIVRKFKIRIAKEGLSQKRALSRLMDLYGRNKINIP